MIDLNNENDKFYFHYLDGDRKVYDLTLKGGINWLGKSSYGSTVITEGQEGNEHDILIIEYLSAVQKWKPRWIKIEQCEIQGTVPPNVNVPNFVKEIGYEEEKRLSKVTLKYSKELEKKLSKMEYEIIELCGMKYIIIPITNENEEFVSNLM